MKMSPSLITLAAAMLATPLSGQGITAGVAAAPTNTGNRDLVVQGTANPACVMKTPTIVSRDNAQVTVRDAGAVDIQLDPGSFVDQATGVPRAATIALGLPITCNTAHHITVQSLKGGLSMGAGTAGSNPSNAFRNHVDFTVELDWSGASKRFDTAQSRSLDAVVNNAGTGMAALRVSIPGGGRPLVAGDYNDTITVKVEAAS